jgi:hypothetical protein
MKNNEHDDGAGHGDQYTVEVHPRDAGHAKLLEEKAADERSDNPEDAV